MREIKSLNEFRFARKVRLINRTIQILLGVSFVIGINFIASKYFERFDITQGSVFTLAAESKAYIRELEAPVKIFVTFPKDPDDPNLVQIHQHIGKLLVEYEAASRKQGEALISIEYVDIYRQRQRARELANHYGLTNENVILVTQGDRRREIQASELFQRKNDQNLSLNKIPKMKVIENSKPLIIFGIIISLTSLFLLLLTINNKFG